MGGLDVLIWRDARGRARQRFDAGAMKRRLLRFAEGLRAPASFAPGGRALIIAACAAFAAAAHVSAPSDPPAWTLAIAACMSALAAFMGWRSGGSLTGFACLCVAAMGLASARMEMRVAAVASPVVEASGRAKLVTGWVERIDPGQRGRVGYVIRVSALEGADPSQTPVRLRVSAPLDDARLGDAVRVRAVLRPPSGPATPGGYDFARRAFFEQLGGTGYALGRLETLDRLDLPIGEQASQAAARLRGHIAARLRASAGERAGPVIAALVTGDRSAVSAETAERLRAAGLGHVLAISGLHVMLVSGTAFFALSLLFAAFEGFARRYDVRKAAALGALLVSTGYLVISGAGVPTQRAYVMAALAFLAILTDRKAISLRGVAVAAVIVLGLRPESAATPGFQMSFAAAASLVAAYEAFRRRQRRRWSAAEPPGIWPGWLAGPLAYMRGSAFTSLVAGAATAPFAAMHFNRIAVYGFFANLIAMPVFSLVVMPFAALAGALAPLGLERPFAMVAAWGWRVVEGVAEVTSGLDGAVSPAAAPPGEAGALAAAALVAGCAFAKGRLRAAAPLALTAFALWGGQKHDSVWVGRGGGAVAVSYDGDVRALALSARGDGYGAESFARRAGASALTDWREAGRCDAQGCVAQSGDQRVAISFNPSGLQTDCERADVVITRYTPPERLRVRCSATLVTPGQAPLILSFSPTGEMRVRRVPQGRPWRRPDPSSR